MRKFGVFDLETDPFKFNRMPQAFCGAFHNGKTTAVFWGPDCVKRLAARMAKFDGLIYAHNGGKFDFHFLIPYLIDRYGEAKVEVLTIGTRIVQIKTPGPEFRDSYAIIPKPLASFGCKDEIDYALFEAEKRDAHKREIVDYLKQDCLGLQDALGAFFKRYGCQLTLASTAFHVMRKEYGIKTPRTNYYHDEKFRPFYFAGRVQFWGLGKFTPKRGKGPLKIVDINSAFPWAMLGKHWFDGGCMRMSKLPGSRREQSFYHITCDSDGALPLRGPDGSVSFPQVEQTEFKVTGWEFMAGLELGLIKNVRYHAVFRPNGVRDFSKFVTDFYEMKRTAETEADRNFAKLILNSSYGKFSLNPRSFKDVRIMPFGEMLPSPWQLSFDDEETGLSYWQRKSFKQDNSKGMSENRSENSEGNNRPVSFNNVCTAASITGCARALLLRSIAACKGVLYCDTDSLIAQDITGLDMGDGLGQWKIEGECSAVWIGGKKLYAAKLKGGGWKTASKGVRLDPEEICRVAEGEEQKYIFEAPSYSLFSSPKFTQRRVNRDDKRKKKGKQKRP
jgi:hypothetical protein